MQRANVGQMLWMGCLVTAILAGPAQAWDPVGDLRNPGRIVKNIEREARNVGRQVDRVRLEAQAQAGAPAFVEWLNQSRRSSSRSAQSIPYEIRQQLQGFYDEDLLNRVRFRVGDAGVFNLANLSIRYGDAEAVTLIDVVVFKNRNDAHYNARLWAHELKHVQQFRDWGTRDFAIRYLRSWNSVENAAYDADRRFAESSRSSRTTRANRGAYDSGIPRPPSFNRPPRPPQVASICVTSYGNCRMGVAVAVGASCYCPSAQGQVWGVAR